MAGEQMTYAAYHRDRPPPQMSWLQSSSAALTSVYPPIKFSSGPAFFGFVSDELQADLASRQAKPQLHSAAQPAPPTLKRSYTTASRMSVKQAAAQAVKASAKRVNVRKSSKIASQAAVASEVLYNRHLLGTFLNSLQP